MLPELVSVLSHWFWVSNVFAFVIVVVTRATPFRDSVGIWAGVGVLLVIIAAGNVVLSQPILLAGTQSLSPGEVMQLKLPTVVSSVVWGGIGITLISKWLTAPCDSKNPSHWSK